VPRSAPLPPEARARLAAGLDAKADSDTHALGLFLAGAFGPACRALVHYGSHVTAGAAARPGSARDFFVVVDDYDAAYRHLVARVETGMDAERAARWARVLAPNVVSVVDPATGMQAKCAVLSAADFARACGPASRDHFTRGRLFQQVLLLWSRDPEARADAEARLVDVRAGTWRWGRPFLPPEFDAEGYCRALLETSFAAEIRPEKADRTGELLAAQGPVLVPLYRALLEQLESAGELVAVAPGRWRLARPATPAEAARLRAYFARSKARATLRWGKYVALYDDWLDYIVKKVERRTGERVELTPRERRWPVPFLLPRALRFLRNRPQTRRPE
jgi:hypothetical protein